MSKTQDSGYQPPDLDPREGEFRRFRVWWIPNPPRSPFIVECDTREEADAALELLTEYDLYLGDLIDANAGGIETRDYVTETGDEWEDVDDDDDD